MVPSMTAADFDINSFRKNILAWYDDNRRVLPWRALPGQKPDPYHVWLSEIMLQQTTVPTVIPYFVKFLEIWPTVYDLANAEREQVMTEWAGLGYYARARNLHKCAQVVSQEYEGVFPDDEVTLKSLPGIGDYTAAAIMAIAFNKPANVVDGNFERVMARLFTVDQPLPGSKKQLRELAHTLSDGRTDRPSDYAQALMDLGTAVCSPKSPKCLLCPVNDQCAGYARGDAGDLPRRASKKAKPHKKGYVYWITKGDSVLFETRSETEMLGGMTGLPTSEWSVSPKMTFVTGLKPNNLLVKHSFTHFDLTLEIMSGPHENVSLRPQNEHFWVSLSEVRQLGLPTLFSKVVKLMA